MKIAVVVLVAVALGHWVQSRQARRNPYWSPSGRGAVAAFAIPKAPPKSSGFSYLAASAPKPGVARPAAAGPRLAPTSDDFRNVLAERKIIRSGQISIELSSYERAASRVEEIATSLGGYVAEAKATSVEGEPASGVLAVRVPSDRFGDALRLLARLGKVRAQEIHSADVTKEYVDLETRVGVKRDAAARMREVLRNRPAQLADIVAAEQELTRIVEEIEAMEGQRRLYDRQVALGTISLNLFEPGVAPVTAEPSVLEPIRDAVRKSGRVLSSSVAGLIYAVSVGLPWSLLLWLLWTLARRVLHRRAARQLA